MKHLGFSFVVFSFTFLSVAVASSAHAVPQIAQFKNSTHVLSLEILKDDLIHFDYSNFILSPNPAQALKTTPIIEQKSFQILKPVRVSANELETSAALIQVDLSTLCFTLFDKKKNEMLTRACPTASASGNTLTLDPMKMQNLYGLGEQFQTPGVVNGDWSQKVRAPGNKYGNTMTEFAGGHTGNAQFPILYALGPDSLNYAFFLDTVYPYRWDFTVSPWKIEQTQLGTDPSFRGYFFLGENLPALRTSFMDLVGRPPVPPKKSFGLWISEFGYRNWAEIEDKIKTLRTHHFPVDGFVLDLYWFGQQVEHDPMSAMGTLTWDTVHFPDPKGRIARFKNDDGVGIMNIEESYVSSGLSNYAPLAKRGYLVGQNPTTPMTFDSWWGKGGGIDWTQPEAGAAWHVLRKAQMTDLGVTSHWTDLGEPEAWDDHDYYGNPLGVGHTEADSHNLYNFWWDKSIADGYEANHENERHFIMSRSGTAGIQRFGAAMWSGDIGSNMRSLSGHLNVQMHMSLSGIDYFGADIGGFNREALEGNVGEVYTRWLANASLLDVPMRPHADDGSKLNYTSPDRIGDMGSNLANIRQRYELAPYYYSLAHHAYRSGQAVVPPLVYYFQSDLNVRQIADEKMVGPSLLVATSSELGQATRSVYLPAGDWYNYHTLEVLHSQGQAFTNQVIQLGKQIQVPVYAKAGAILPKMWIDDQSMNILGRRTQGAAVADLIVQVFAGVQKTEFNLVEDDGVTEAYRKNSEFAETMLTQEQGPSLETVRIAGTTGSYAGAPTSRRNEVFLVTDHKEVSSVRVNGAELAKFAKSTQLETADSGWTIDENGVTHVKTVSLPVKDPKVFEFIYGNAL